MHQIYKAKWAIQKIRICTDRKGSKFISSRSKKNSGIKHAIVELTISIYLWQGLCDIRMI